MKPEKTYSPYTGLLLLFVFLFLTLSGGAVIFFFVLKSLVLIWSHL